MTSDDPLCQQMMTDILETIEKFSRSEPMTMMGHAALEMIIELLRIAIESDDEAVGSDRESILTLYEND
jgi:hypothetical protein